MTSAPVQVMAVRAIESVGGNRPPSTGANRGLRRGVRPGGSLIEAEAGSTSM